MTGQPDAGCDSETVAAFSSGELDPAAREKVAEHLVDCDMCWQQMRVSRAVTTAVQQLWEPAPAGLAADLRAAVLTADATLDARSGRRRAAVLAVAATVLILGGTVAATRALTHSPEPPVASRTTELPAPVQRALEKYAHAAPGFGDTASAPDLRPAGFRVESASQVGLAGTSASLFTYALPGSTGRVAVFITTAVWPTPTSARGIGARSWIQVLQGVTIVGGSDVQNDHMLVIATDHQAAMITAAALGLV